ncbi:MAG: SRPBCC family protein [Planctomycetes bacterium]|nr:SRPBCC family protein [Planctomycetota bacterium]
MSATRANLADPKLDLVLERVVDVPAELVWLAWTSPEHLKKWFTPAPWKTVDCELDLRPGGQFRTVMQSPEGQQFPTVGCYLEIVPKRKLVWTSALEPGYRPAKRTAVEGLECSELLFTAVITLEPHGKGTKYTATALHRNEADAKKHLELGFHEGWGKALDQLVELAKTM